MIQFAGVVQDVGGEEVMSATIRQPGTKREITLSGLTMAECRILAEQLYDGVVLLLLKVVDTNSKEAISLDLEKVQTDLDYVTQQRDIAWGAIQTIKHGPPTWLSNDQVAAWAQSEADKGLAAVTSPTSNSCASEKP